MAARTPYLGHSQDSRHRHLTLPTVGGRRH
jgi:hypothetical protein